MEITDPRTVLDFQKTTFCGHPRARVSKVILENVALGHADYTCFWSLEFLCSGLVHSLWMTLFEAAALHVNRAQPNVFLYLTKAYEAYAPIESKYSVRDMTTIRNNNDVRRMVCEAAAVVAQSRKNKLPSLPGIKPTHDFDPVTIQESLKAPSTLYGQVALRREDPMTVAVPVNEFCYCLRADVRDTARALYWMAWTFAVCREHKKQTKQPLVFADRSDAHVGVAHGRHVVWLFWECIKRQCPPTSRDYIDALFNMYCLRWSPSDAKPRQALLIAAIVLVCEGASLDTTPVSGETLAISTLLNGIPGWLDAISRTQKSLSS
jgi:hypothetical protein